MIAPNGNHERRRAEALLDRLNAVVPTLVQPLGQRAFDSHVRDLVAVGRAYLQGHIDWAALLVGVETAYFQARACCTDDACAEALHEAWAHLARQAARAFDGPNAGGAPQKVDGKTPECAPGEPSGTGFANTNTKSFPEDESLEEITEHEITNTYEPGGLAS